MWLGRRSTSHLQRGSENTWCPLAKYVVLMIDPPPPPPPGRSMLPVGAGPSWQPPPTRASEELPSNNACTVGTRPTLQHIQRTGSLELQLHPNLSLQATREFEQLLICLQDCHPNANLQDKRSSPFTHQDLNIRHFYNLLTFSGVSWQFTAYVWNAIIPLKHRIFLWLAFKGRLNTRDNMVRKHWSAMSPVADCDACLATETISHIILRCCKHSSQLWDQLAVTQMANSAQDIAVFVQQVHATAVFGQLWCILFAACAVSAWQARNDRTFNKKIWTPRFLLFNTAELLKLWSNRARHALDKQVLLSWAARFHN